MIISEQLRLLRELVDEDERLNAASIADEGRKHFSSDAADSMRDILAKLESSFYENGLTKKQLSFVKSVYERTFDMDAEPPVLMSSGKIPRGKDVPTPDVLRNLPLRPPTTRKTI